MQEKKIGFIGGGNMAKAIIGGLINSGQVAPSAIWIYDRKASTNQEMAEQYGIHAAESAEALAQHVDVLFGAVKPNVILRDLNDLATCMKKRRWLSPLRQALPPGQSGLRTGTRSKNHSGHAEYPVSGGRRDDLGHAQCAG